jgi:hypothetical protein
MCRSGSLELAVFERSALQVCRHFGLELAL